MDKLKLIFSNLNKTDLALAIIGGVCIIGIIVCVIVLAVKEWRALVSIGVFCIGLGIVAGIEYDRIKKSIPPKV